MLTEVVTLPSGKQIWVERQLKNRALLSVKIWSYDSGPSHVLAYIAKTPDFEPEIQILYRLFLLSEMAAFREFLDYIEKAAEEMQTQGTTP
jgi:hypothetical protein